MLQWVGSLPEGFDTAVGGTSCRGRGVPCPALAALRRAKAGLPCRLHEGCDALPQGLMLQVTEVLRVRVPAGREGNETSVFKRGRLVEHLGVPGDDGRQERVGGAQVRASKNRFAAATVSTSPSARMPRSKSSGWDALRAAEPNSTTSRYPAARATSGATNARRSRCSGASGDIGAITGILAHAATRSGGSSRRADTPSSAVRSPAAARTTAS
jgi:hypothetical protein